MKDSIILLSLSFICSVAYFVDTKCFESVILSGMFLCAGLILGKLEDLNNNNGK